MQKKKSSVLRSRRMSGEVLSFLLGAEGRYVTRICCWLWDRPLR